MARAADPASLELVVGALRARPEGATVEQLARSFGKLPRRTLQRRLAQLVQDGRVLIAGRRKNRRYHFAGIEPGLKALAVSRPAVEIRELVQRPLFQRMPVGYRREFLEGYRPNGDAYLDP